MPWRAIGSIWAKAALNLETAVWKMRSGLARATSSVERAIDAAAAQGLDAGELSQVLADFGGVNVNAADDFRPRFGGGEF